MCFLDLDNGISQIFSISFNFGEYFLCIIWRLVCPKMCCKNFENRLTILNRDFSVPKKKSWKGGNYFPAKLKNS